MTRGAGKIVRREEDTCKAVATWQAHDDLRRKIISKWLGERVAPCDTSIVLRKGGSVC